MLKREIRGSEVVRRSDGLRTDEELIVVAHVRFTSKVVVHGGGEGRVPVTAAAAWSRVGSARVQVVARWLKIFRVIVARGEMFWN